eukprot:67603-Pleurochrysis_carterae.AAC.1
MPYATPRARGEEQVGAAQRLVVRKRGAVTLVRGSKDREQQRRRGWRREAEARGLAGVRHAAHSRWQRAP